MDNILKLLLGVLAISGTIALLVPSENPVAPPVATAPALPETPTPATAEAVVEEAEPDAEADIGDDELDSEDFSEEDFRIGEPSIDGQPFGGSYEPPSNGPTAVSDQVANPDGSAASPENNGGVMM